MDSSKLRITLALVFAAVLLLDNITTWLAVSHGAVEKNPIAAIFLYNIYSWLLFTFVKVIGGFYLVYYLYPLPNEKIDYSSYRVLVVGFLTAYALVLGVFARAVVVNVLNILAH